MPLKPLLFHKEYPISPIKPVREISVFGIKDCPRTLCDIRLFYHTHYTNDEIQSMIDIMSPILQGKYQFVSPQECLNVEKKATEDYLNFGD